MAIFRITIVTDADERYFDQDVLEETIARLAANGGFVFGVSNFSIPVERVGPWKIESGFIRRAG